jgi:hypothetical protein
VITVPADNCPACLTIDRSETTDPYFTQPDGESVTALCQCGRCGHFWKTSYLLSALAEAADPAA